MWRITIVALAILSCQLPKLSAGTVKLTDAAEDIALGGYVQYFEDSTGKMNPAAVIAKDQWLSPPDSSLGFPPSPNHLWFRIDIDRTDSQKNWVLRLDYPLLDTIELHLPRHRVVPVSLPLQSAATGLSERS